MASELNDQIARLALTDQFVGTLDVQEARSELADNILKTVRTRHAVRSRNKRLIGRNLAIPAICSIIALTYLLVPKVEAPREEQSTAAYSLAAVKVAESAPRYLVNLPGWKVKAAAQFTSQYGHLIFTDGRRELEINWYLATDYETRVEGNEVDTIDLDGTVVHVLYNGPHGGGDYNGVWLSEDRTLTARGHFPSLADYRRVIESLEVVNVERWLDAMPDNVVKPESRRQAVDAILADIPIPPGLDVEALRTGEGVLELYHLGAEVAGEVFCGWMGIWHDARKKGDSATAAAASEAMATSRDWDILNEMKEQGAFPQVMWEFVDAMPNDGLIPAGRAMRLSEVDLKASMGCELTELPPGLA